MSHWNESVTLIKNTYVLLNIRHVVGDTSEGTGNSR